MNFIIYDNGESLTIRVANISDKNKLPFDAVKKEAEAYIGDCIIAFADKLKELRELREKDFQHGEEFVI